MKKRINRICAIYMAIIVCLSGAFVFVVYQQDQMIKEQGGNIRVWDEQLIESAKAYDDLLRKYQHDIWHYEEQSKSLYAENQRMHEELINSELYKVDYESVGEYVTMRSYRKVEPEPVIKYVKVPVEVIKEVEVIVYRNIYARKWESVEQFEQWYEDLDFRVLMPSSVYTVDCDDYSARLQRLALEMGYPVSEAMAKNGLYCGVKVTKFGAGTGEIHAGNLVLIDNDYYWVEPHPEKFYIKQLFERD